MQFEARDAFDLGREAPATREPYGNGEFANACLIARRLAERGVRIVQVYYGNGQPWDDHADIDNHRNHAQKSRPADRRAPRGPEGARPARRHAGHLGRRVRPHARLAKGPRAATTTACGFTMWLAGGGVKGGHIHGATDEFGFARRRGHGPRPRPPRHDPPPDGHRPREADLSLQRPRLPPDRRQRRSGAGDPRLRHRSQRDTETSSIETAFSIRSPRW